jgi:predicted  nucleic acid-binding Zn-ribbon protein
MSSLVGKMSDNQYRDRNTIIALQTELEKVSKKTESARYDINKCQEAITTMESKLGNLSTREENNQRFDEIKLLLVEQSSRRGRRLLTTGKRKEHIQEEDEEMGREEDEDIYVDISPTMDTNDNTLTNNINGKERGGDDTNSLAVYEEHHTPPLK